ncbi:MAG TPA: hypothetical protein VHE83_13145, partial [Mycobacteriales bacterium]|nr:hypothetical protein [Mycobacteriales bacterium]
PTAAPGAPTTPAAASAVATRPAPRSIAVQTSAPAAHRPSPAKPAPSKSAVAPVGAKPGTYSEATTGTIKSALGTMSADGDTTLTVSADKGRDQEQKEVDKNSTTDEIARFAADGSVRFTYLHISSAAFDDTFTFTTPELVFPAKPAPGQTWSWSAKSDDGKTTITFKGTYKGTEDVTIGGTVVHCLIVQADFTLQSDTTITVTQTADYAPAYGLIVRQHQMASGTAYGTPFTADTTTTLKSLTPQ